MIAKLFEITDFIDKARWGNKDNYNLINFYRSDLSNDAKILTHWICYIADRQMDFRRVWDLGGYVFSEMVDQIKIRKDMDLLNPHFPKKSFFIKREDYKDSDNYFTKEDKGKYLFVSHQPLKDNEILIEYDEVEKGDHPFFISRYYPSDYLSILYTFCILKDYNFNLSQYIISLTTKYHWKEDFIPRLLFGLFLLSYYDIGQPKASDLTDFNGNIQNAEKRKENVEIILNKPKAFEEGLKYFKEDIIFKQKRAWCSLRDFLKSPKFNGYFFGALSENGFNDIAIFKSKAVLKYLELPGDVWNNNPTFRECILKGTTYENSKLPFSKLLRTIYDDNKKNIPEGYPEQFDITFDFVPRMCEMNNCSFCPYGLLNGEAIDFQKLCINNREKFCPILLVSCNYKMDCKGQDCLLLRYL